MVSIFLQVLSSNRKLLITTKCFTKVYHAMLVIDVVHRYYSWVESLVASILKAVMVHYGNMKESSQETVLVRKIVLRSVLALYEIFYSVFNFCEDMCDGQ